MMNDRLFDAAEVSDTLAKLAPAGGNAFESARSALERSDPDAPTLEDLRALSPVLRP